MKRGIVSGCLSLIAIAMAASADGFIHVTPTGGATATGASWEEATSLTNAIAIAPEGSVVIVSNGTYHLDAPLVINRPVTVCGYANDWDEVILQGPAGATAVEVSHAAAVLEYVTVKGGTRCIHLYDGTVAHCRLTGAAVTSAKPNGAGLYIVGGTARNCRIDGNTAAAGNIAISGFAVYQTGGLVEGCRIVDNQAPGFSVSQAGKYVSTVRLGGGTMRNCIIAGNSLGFVNANTRTDVACGVYIHGSAQLLNCLIRDNHYIGLASSIFGVYAASPATVANCIIEHNGLPDHDTQNIGGTKARFFYCAMPASETSGTDHAIPLAVGMYEDYVYDYSVRALAGSPLVDAGRTSDWTGETAVDLNGAARVAGGGVDVGPVEYQPAAFDACFTADRGTGFGPFAATLTAAVAGAADDDEIIYFWDLDGDGVAEQSSSTLASVMAHFATVGEWVVTLWATNTTASPAVGASWTSRFAVREPYYYVVTNNPSAAHPYTTWTTAATSLADAIEAAEAGATVIISNGTYKLPGPITVSKPLFIKSWTDSWRDVILSCATFTKNSSASALILRGYGITLSGVTVRDLDHGIKQSSGGAINLLGATATNCHVTACANMGWRSFGLAIYNNDGRVLDCLIDGNTRSTSAYKMASYFALYQEGGNALTEQCIITNNLSPDADLSMVDHRCAPVGVAAGTVRNCLIGWNGIGTITAEGTWPTACGVRLNGGTLENCTVIGNTSAVSPNGVVSGVALISGTVVNCLIADNVDTDSDAINWGGIASDFMHCCTTPVEGLGDDCVATTDRTYRVRAGRVELASASPCIGAGLNADWQLTATDLYGARRRIGSRVDIGCVESARNPGLTISVQ
jgi:hypothetical protein